MKGVLLWLTNLRTRFGIWFWVSIALILGLPWFFISSGNKSIKVQVAKVTSGDIVESVSTSGSVKADQYSALTFPAGGKIMYVNVKPGDKMITGQAIAGIDTVALNAAYQNALNTYRGTKAAVDLEHDNDKNYGTNETFTQRNTRTAAEVANDNAYNNVLAAQNNLKNANIYAPFNGVMDTVNPSSPGMDVTAGAANYTIVNPDTVYFSAEVSETDLPNVSMGQKVEVKLDAYPDEIINGTVANIGLVAFTSSTGGNAYAVRITLPSNSNFKFRIGMQGDANIVFNTIKNTLKIPSSAIVSEGDKNFVWIVENGRAKKAEVSLGASSLDENEVKSGLLENQQVIENPATTLKNGQKVGV